jgi:hypothetical protein
LIEREKKMSRLSISSFYAEDLPFELAVQIISKFDRKSLLDSLKSFEDFYYQEVNKKEEDAEEEFFSDWHYEINAFNVVCREMSKIF